jgi:hypothetical protein
MKSSFYCYYVMSILLLVSLFVTAYAAQHNGVCVPAETKFSIISNDCQLNILQQCIGGATVQQIVVNGYCDTTETGDCYDATAAFSIIVGPCTVCCKKGDIPLYPPGLPPSCAPNTSEASGTTATVSAPSCY